MTSNSTKVVWYHATVTRERGEVKASSTYNELIPGGKQLAAMAQNV